MVVIYFCGITLGFCLMKELWKYLHRMEHQEEDENDPLFAVDKEGSVLVNAQLQSDLLSFYWIR
jgi:hypothetical protein